MFVRTPLDIHMYPCLGKPVSLLRGRQPSHPPHVHLLMKVFLIILELFIFHQMIQFNTFHLSLSLSPPLPSLPFVCKVQIKEY
jgi:hypothetical protein